MSSGTQTAALAFGGASPARALTEDWNGASWSEVADLNTARDLLAGAGAAYSSFSFWWIILMDQTQDVTEEWSGSSNTIKVLTD